MQLKQLTINGFKSFADPTTINFVDGLTGIVGPNGSGKSNITEAIRWALGESSAKSLRGEKMGDIIFAGTTMRPPLNRAEVTMVFDNSDGYLKEQGDTVTIARRLYRDGESDFLINKQNVRLKDIVDLFMDSGLGKESFSFISQGRVESIFNSKPEERRGILEEAAGVLKYKQQKAKAQKELKETDDNLDRVNDIASELKNQVTPLAEQASLARDYERQMIDYERIHKSILALELKGLATEQATIAGSATKTQQTLLALNDKIKRLEEKTEQLTATDADLETQLNAVNDELLSESMRLESLTGEANVSSEKVNSAQSTLSDLEAQKTSAENDAKEAAQVLEKLLEEQEEKQRANRALEEELKALEDKTPDPKRLSTALEKQQSDYIDLLQKQADNKNAIAATNKEAQLAQNQSTAEQERLHGLKVRFTAQKARVGELESQLFAGKEALKNAQEALRTREGALQEARTRYESGNKALNDARAIYERAAARYETLKELKEDYTGFYAGVKAVLKHKASLNGVIGAVAELIAVPTDYQQAIDVALGGSLQNIITTDERAAKAGISYLKANRLGRATFMPLSVVKPRELPAAQLERIASHPGFVGLGINLVRFRAELQPVIGNLLGNLVVARTIDDAIAIANLSGHRFRIVSLEGDILTPGGAMTGGQTRQQKGSSPLARTAEVTTLKAQLTTMVQALDEKKQQVTQLAQAVNVAQAELEESQRLTSSSEAQQQSLTNQLEEQQALLTRMSREQEAMTLEIGESTDYAALLEELEQTREALSKAVDENAQRTETLKAQLENASEAMAAHQEQHAALQTQIAVLKNALATSETQISQWQMRESTAKSNAERVFSRIRKIESEAKNLEENTENRKQTIARLKASTEALREKQAGLTTKKADNRSELSAASAQLTTAYTQQKQAMAESEQQSVALNRTKINLEQRLTTLSETYQLTYEAALAETKEEAENLPALKSRLKLLKRGIDELGPVNPNAIAEYEHVKERYDFLTQQQEDLYAARDQLLTTMGELDAEVASRFKEVFDQTNAAFQMIFPKMFGGGAAELSLTNPDDLLNTGLEISAQPPGKKLQRLSLLSGGERALTAIVLLFAILQVRPVPFSILDEVEASLDEVNVNRFGEFLKHYSSDTQFIVITHRRGTMLAADVLYGVTMQESGVSKMMSVSLDALTEEQEA